ncbi:MAG: hypothetical protein U9O94_08650 [Nanoarchaeota archaeon]|nr:hypothetical protein [Nanoarchaeota archaeon]
MTIKVFKVKNEKYNGADLGLKQANELCTLLGIKLITDDQNHYGYFNGEYKGYNISIIKHRTIDIFTLLIDGIRNSGEKIKELSQIQVNNLKARLDKHIAEDKRRNRIRYKRSEIHRKLHLLGIQVSPDRYIKCKGFDFYFESDTTIKVTSKLTISYLNLNYGTPVLAQAELMAISKEYEQRRQLCLEAMDKLNDHKQLIKEYYAL